MTVSSKMISKVYYNGSKTHGFLDLYDETSKQKSVKIHDPGILGYVLQIGTRNLSKKLYL